MSKRIIFLVILAVGLGAAALWMRGFFDKETIDILVQVRPLRNARAPQPGEVLTEPVTFGFREKYRFTEIRVVAADDAATNKYPHALWHLVTDSNSAPSQVLVYGVAPKGMRPKIPKARPDPLEPGVIYTLHVEAGGATGEKKFHTREAVSASRAQ